MPQSNFEVVLADTSEARRIHYRLRYQVFCLETGFEDASSYPEQEERDSFDAHAKHFIVRDTRSQAWVAATRVILPGGGLLPVEHHGGLACPTGQNVRMYLRKNTAEVSRLLIAEGTPGPYLSLNSHPPLVSGRQSPPAQPRRELRNRLMIIRELLRGIAAYGVESNIPQAAFFVTRALARMVTSMGIELTLIGAPFEHRGLRYPYIINTEQVYDALSQLIYKDDNGLPAYRLFSQLPLAASSEAA